MPTNRRSVEGPGVASAKHTVLTVSGLMNGGGIGPGIPVVRIPFMCSNPPSSWNSHSAAKLLIPLAEPKRWQGIDHATQQDHRTCTGTPLGIHKFSPCVSVSLPSLAGTNSNLWLAIARDRVHGSCRRLLSSRSQLRPAREFDRECTYINGPFTWLTATSSHPEVRAGSKASTLFTGSLIQRLCGRSVPLTSILMHSIGGPVYLNTSLAIKFKAYSTLYCK